MELPAERVNEALIASKFPVSLSSGGDEDGRVPEIPEPDAAESLTERLALRELLTQLDEKDRRLIELRYYGYKTQTETAKELGMTQVQVSRREKKLLLMLREKLK